MCLTISCLGAETPVKRFGVATHQKLLSPALDAGRRSSPHPLPLPSLAISPVSGLGLVRPAPLSSALLCWIWQLLWGKVIHPAHPSIHTYWPHSPLLSSQPALMLCDQQTRWRKRADNVTPPPLAFHARYAPEDGSFRPQNNWAGWNTVTTFEFFFYKA